eukprot:maker-scaffold_67-snap-gene-0.5-mRNA-1 protein AED:0.00 eAED:0.00 QI:126/1/1/1/0/0/2/85/286
MNKTREAYKAKANTNYRPEHTGNGIMFEVTARHLLPVDSLIVTDLSVSLNCSSIEIWVSDQPLAKWKSAPWKKQQFFDIVSNDNFTQHAFYKTKLTLPMESHIHLHANETKTIYIFTSTGALTYCDERYPISYQDEFLTVNSGIANLCNRFEPHPFDPMYMRPFREFRGEIFFQVEYSKFSPSLSKVYLRKYSKKYLEVAKYLLSNSMVLNLPQHLIIHILQQIPPTWFENDNFSTPCEHICSGISRPEYSPLGWNKPRFYNSLVQRFHNAPNSDLSSIRSEFNII